MREIETDTTTGEDTSRRHLAAVFLLAFAVLTWEVCVTRVFSVVLAHHYVFLAVSVAVCGLGMGGLGLHVWRTRRGAGEGDVALPAGAAGFGLTSLACLVLLLRWLLPRHLEIWWFAGVLLLVPFCFAGVFLAALFTRYGSSAGRFYAADLGGSGLAAVGAVGLLHALGGVGACLLASALAAWAGRLCAVGRRARIATSAAAWLATAFLALEVVVGVLPIGAVHTDRRIELEGLAKPLMLDLALEPGERPVVLESRWNAFARTDLVENPGFGEYRDAIYQVFTNGHVPTYMMRVDADLRRAPMQLAIGKIPALGHLSSNSVLAFEATTPDRVLCIGPGGGADVILALIHGASVVEGAELNASILELMDEHAEFNGHLYEREDVRVVAAEGRSYVRRSPGGYDLIYAALTQTATAGGAAALMENYVYTAEAFRDYWDHLSDDGALALIVHEQSLLMRLVITALELLESEGLSGPEASDHLAFFDDPASPYRFLLVVTRKPLSGVALRLLEQRSRELEVTPMFLPGVSDGPLGPLVRGTQTWQELVASARYVDVETGQERRLHIEPVRDDRPFFFDVFGGLPAGLAELCIGAAALVLLFSLAAWQGRGRGTTARGRVAPFALYFAALGIGFMLIEIPLIQKLTLTLGYPTLALTATLFALLVGGGVGSWVSQRIEDEALLPRTIAGCALTGAGLAVLLVAVLPAVEPLLLHATLPVRLAAVSFGLLLLGFFLGTLFPSGLRLLASFGPGDVPWMWGVNGVCSVVGSLLAVLLANLVGFRATLLAGAAVYVLAALLSGALGRAARATPGAGVDGS